MKETATASISVFWVAFFILLILKLTKTVTWSWWIIFAPLWIPIAGTVIICLILFLISLKSLK